MHIRAKRRLTLRILVHNRHQRRGHQQHNSDADDDDGVERRVAKTGDAEWRDARARNSVLWHKPDDYDYDNATGGNAKTVRT